MLLNKYFEILRFYLGDYTREIYGRELLDKIALSQKNIALTLKDLENSTILKSRITGNIKYYRLNLANLRIKDILLLVEITNKISFLEDYLKIANVFEKNDDRIIGIFGSYAKSRPKRYSDIDVFIIGNKKNSDYDEIGKYFDLNISIKYFSEKDFRRLLKEKNNLLIEIVKNHIILYNAEKFIKLVWECYHGFN